MTALRPYQSEAIAAVYDYWRAGGGNPLIDLATGTGKSVVLAQLIRDLVEGYQTRIIVLTHVKELVEQDFRATLRLWPACPAGINSAGLGRRDTRAQVLFASIQSVHRFGPDLLGKRDVIIIDEAHLVPASGDGMYLKFIERMRDGSPDLRIVGLTATPYRLDSGRLDQGEGRIFDDVIYSYGIGEGVRDGFLSPLISRAGHSEIDVSGVGRRGGEFIDGMLQRAAADADLVAAACREIVERGQDRRGWIVFCAGVDHAEQVAAKLREHGVPVASVTGDTERADRDRAIRDFKAGNLRCLTSVGVLTTGFDAPHVDMIAMLRPTLSTGLYVQMLGRGTRLADGKSNCLVLDFSGNVRRHGPVDAIEVRGRSSGEAGERDEVAVKPDSIRAKACPSCEALVSIRAIECIECGHVWPVKPKHEAKADRDAPVMSAEMEQVWHHVNFVRAREHVSASTGNTTLRIKYLCDLTIYSEWLACTNGGWAQEKAERWFQAMTRRRHPDAATHDRIKAWADDISANGVDCVAIRVKRDGKFWRVIDRRRRDGSTVDEKLRITPALERAAA